MHFLNFFIFFLAFVVEMEAQEGTAGPISIPQYYPGVKCNFVIFGQYTYNEAREACKVRQAGLAFFTNPSEEYVVRNNIGQYF